MAENQTEDRLTKDGGTAEVNIEAVPAVRLLFDDGDKLEVKAREVDIPIDDIQGKSFKEFDGFNEVDVRLALSTGRPVLRRKSHDHPGRGDDLYGFTFRGSTSPAEVGEFALRGCRRCCARP